MIVTKTKYILVCDNSECDHGVIGRSESGRAEISSYDNTTLEECLASATQVGWEFSGNKHLCPRCKHRRGIERA